MTRRKRILLLMPTKTYRASAFLAAAQNLPIEPVIGSERQQALQPFTPGKTVTLHFRQLQTAVRQIKEFSRSFPLDAILPVDDETILLAALAAKELGLPYNSITACKAVTEKHTLRTMLKKSELPSPDFQVLQINAKPEENAGRVNYPCVLKPVFLSASRGVIRANSEKEFIEAFHRIKSILRAPDIQAQGGELSDLLLVESFIPGDEIAFEGTLTDGKLKLLTIFDKPDPLEGPYFEETIYVTPSRHSKLLQKSIIACVDKTCKAIGLKNGPVHAELRLNEKGVWIIEIAGRSIGGYCSQTLTFANGMSLEELILRQTIGEDISDVQREKFASGVMMIPIPQKGVLQSVEGVDEAKMISGVQNIIMSIPISREVVPLPEGNRYLGFIFAKGDSPATVEGALREAHKHLHIMIQ